MQEKNAVLDTLNTIQNQLIDNKRLTVTPFFKPVSSQKMRQAYQAESNQVYKIWLDDIGNGRSGSVVAEFLCLGRGGFTHLVFFRRSMRGGTHVIHGIPSWSLIKDAERVIFESEDR